MGARKSAKYLFIGALFSKGISFIGSIFLARLLFPEDFGYLLISSIVTGLIQVFGNMGFETFYLQEKIDSKEDEEKILNITYKLRILVNIILFFIQIAISYIAEIYYDSQVVGEMIRIFAFSIPIMAFSQINLYILRKKLNYKPEVYANLGRDILGTFTKVFFACLGFGALSFAVGAVLGNIVRYFIIKYYQDFKPKWQLWDRMLFEKIFYFGKHSFFTGIGMFFTQQIDKILLSAYFNTQSIGNYYFANSQAQSIFTYIISPQSSLVLSYSAKYKEKTSYLFSKLTTIGYLLGIIMLPIVVFLVAYTNTIFSVVFGDKWDESIYMFQFFIIYFLITEITFPFSGIITAYGRPEIASRLVFVRFVCLAVSLFVVVTCFKDINYYLYTFLTISFIFSWIKAYIAIEIIMKKSIIQYIQKLKHLLILSLIYIGIVWIANSLYSVNIAILSSLFTIIAVSVILHLTIYKKEFFEVLVLIFGTKHKLVQRLQK